MAVQRSGALAFLAVAATLMAGCSGPAPPLVETRAELPTPEEASGAVANETRSEEVYRFAGMRTGTPGNVTEVFEAPNATISLEFRFRFLSDTCAAEGRVDVTRSNGELAYRFEYICAVGFVVGFGSQGVTVPGLGPGNYTVKYVLAGVVELEFSVHANILVQRTDT